MIRSKPDSTQLQTPVLIGTGGGADSVSSGLDVQGVEGGPGGDVLGVGIDGGPGDDVLVGGPGPDQLFGGGGADRLRGGGGGDGLFDASLRDFLPTGDRSDPVFPLATLPPGRGRDSFDGGSGKDSVSYAGRIAKVRIDLGSSKPVAGARGERDSIRGVENAIGGAGDDRIAGNRAANSLTGAKGDDLLVGRAGADDLAGGEGRDVIRGGPGDDGIRFRDADLPSVAAADRISCGSGLDSIGAVYPRDFVAEECESLNFYPIRPPRTLQPSGVDSFLPLRRGRPPRVLRGGLSCFLVAVCRARVELRVRGPGSRRGQRHRAARCLAPDRARARSPKLLGLVQALAKQAGTDRRSAARLR